MGQLLTTAIKASAFIIGKPLSELVTESFEFGSFPQKLKYSQVKLIVFKDYKVELLNYRPISLFPIFSQMFKKIMIVRMQNH